MIENVMKFNDTDYKHVLQDMSTAYLGARMSYQEIIENDDVPFKFKAAVDQFVLKDTVRETMLADHLFELKKADSTYMIFKQLHVKIKVTAAKELIIGKPEKGYTSKVYSLDEFMNNEVLHRHKEALVVEEIQFSKLRLMGI